MDQKRALTSVDLAALETELRAFCGTRVEKAYLYEDDLLRVKCSDRDHGRVELLAAVRDPKHVHVADPAHVPDAPDRPPNFAEMLRNRIGGATLVGVDQYEFDRILSFEFERDGGRTTIVIELFGDGNVAVLGQERQVISSLDTVRLKSRTVAPGTVYEFPSSRFDPMTADYEAFVAKMNQSDTDVVRTLATQLNFGGFWGEELCTRADVEKTLDIENAGDTVYERLFDVVERLRERLHDGRFDSRVYYERKDNERGQPVHVAPVPLQELESTDCETFESFNQALDAYFYELDSATQEEPSGTDRPDFESEIAKFERIIDQQQGAIEEFEQQAEREREKAESLYSNYDVVDEILTTVREARDAGHSWGEVEERFEQAAEAGNERAGHVVGVQADTGMVTVDLDGARIDLDPRKGVEHNADRLYQEAKRIEEKKAGAEAAIEETRADLKAAERRREEWESGDLEAEKDGDEDEAEVDWLARSSVPIRYDEKWFERFRWFRTSDDFLVLGGRDADQNEELVKKYMDPSDRFLHAQAHGAPVTILKATDPSEPARDVTIPERSFEEAARFAVSYSSVWKDGKFAGDVYMVEPDQVSKTPESGEFLEKGGFAIRGDRTYFEDTPVDVAIGIACEPETRVLGGPEAAISKQAETHAKLEPGQYAQNDIAMILYREFKERFTDESFVRKVASADRIQEFCPAGGSRLVD